VTDMPISEVEIGLVLVVQLEMSIFTYWNCLQYGREFREFPYSISQRFAKTTSKIRESKSST